MKAWVTNSLKKLTHNGEVMNRTLSVLLVLFGLGLVALGLLFFIGSGGKTYRFAIGAVALALGAVAIGYGMRLFKDANKLLPSYIIAEILDLARKKNGEISEPDLMAMLGSRWSHARQALQEMLSTAVCKKRLKRDVIYYIFEGMLPRLTIRRCEFCGAELPLDDNITSCPNCGGTIKTKVESLSLDQSDVFSMDE